jgi:DNA-binding response OmpR family regulator
VYEVLVVAPEVLIQNKVAGILEGFKVTICGRPDDALMHLRSKQFHCIVVDAVLSAFLPFIRPVSENVSIVLLEQRKGERRKGGEVDSVACDDACIWDVVEAPFHSEHLTRAVREASEIAAMPPEVSKRLGDGFEHEATRMRQIGRDALNDTGIFAPTPKEISSSAKMRGIKA